MSGRVPALSQWPGIMTIYLYFIYTVSILELLFLVGTFENIFILFGKAETKIFCLLGSLPKCPQQLGPGQTKARSQDLYLGLTWKAGTQVLDASFLLPRVHMSRMLESGTELGL